MMGDKPAIISDDMNITDSTSQHIRNNTTFAIVFNSINNNKQIEYVTAISKIIPAEYIQFVSRISKNRFCIFFNSQAAMENLLKTHSSIYVNEIEISIRRLINGSKRTILSNVYPNIPNQPILNTLHEAGIKTSSQISHMKAGFATEQFSHILSFRRQVYISQDSVSKLPSSITVTVENTTFRIFITDDTVTCFQCHKTGHFSSQCKNIPEQINILDITETHMETKNDEQSVPINVEENVTPSPLTVNTQNIDTTQNNVPPIPNNTKNNEEPTYIDLPKKHSLVEKLKSSSIKNVNTTPPTTIKRPAPSTSSQPLSPKSLLSTSPSPIMKPPNAPDGKTQIPKNLKGNVHKKPKVRTSTSSNDSFYSNIDEGLDPTEDLFNSNPQMPLSLNQFKDFFENSQGCTDLESLCTEHNTSPEIIIEIITNIYPAVKMKSIKNRLTRLSKALETVQVFKFCQTSNANSNDDETY
ncbi:unnamed protein product [Macrosiphum euphorbiae]|uniref:CCHC-type domain-containing protein n=1 Tax=Macrosiphum euphorbiae TaxID=13131 RepID=A0AAV0XYQ0_9HEMI|nr:unnamed protein product [Macrosiphum euphorbiae]